MSHYDTSASLEAEQDAKNAAGEDRELNPEPPHATALKKVDRGPHLYALAIPTCVICGPIGPALDREDAKRAADRHEASVAASVVAAEVGGE